jgi:hypothetical protein
MNQFVATVVSYAFSLLAEGCRPRLNYDCLHNLLHILTKKAYGLNYTKFTNSYLLPHWIISRQPYVLCSPTSVDVTFVSRYLRVSHRRCAVSCCCNISMLLRQTWDILGVLRISFHDSVVRVSTFERKILRKIRGVKESGSLGRPRRRWKDNIRMELQEVECGGMDWIGLAQDRDRWRAIVNAVMNLWVQ